MNFEQLNHSHIYEMRISSDRIEAKAYRRISSAHIWDDLWTNPDQYDMEVKPKNKGASIDGIYSRQGWIDDPIVPNPVVMFGWFDLLERTEFPSNTIHWNIVSQRILQVMNTYGVYPRIHPIRVFERTQFPNVYGLDIRQLEHEEFTLGMTHRDDWFYGIQLPLSHYVLAGANPDSDIQKLGHNASSPAFFSIPDNPGQIFLNQEARVALETADIHGIRFDGPFSFTVLDNGSSPSPTS